MGVTTGAVVISYDINRMHTSVKEKMKELGYFDNWHYGHGPTYFMPNTTLWHKNKSSDSAIKDMEYVCYELGVTLERAIAVLASEFSGI